MDKNKRKDLFEWWVSVNPDRIITLFDTLPSPLVKQLDYSLMSLIPYEEYLLNNYTYEEIIKEENRTKLDDLSRYVGEVARRNLKNAKWDLYLKDKKNIYYNVPIISAPYIFGGMFCPSYVTCRAMLRHKGDDLYGEYIYLVLKDEIERQKKAEMLE